MQGPGDHEESGQMWSMVEGVINQHPTQNHTLHTAPDLVTVTHIKLSTCLWRKARVILGDTKLVLGFEQVLERG